MLVPGKWGRFFYNRPNRHRVLCCSDGEPFYRTHGRGQAKNAGPTFEPTEGIDVGMKAHKDRLMMGLAPANRSVPRMSFALYLVNLQSTRTRR